MLQPAQTNALAAAAGAAAAKVAKETATASPEKAAEELERPVAPMWLC